MFTYGNVMFTKIFNSFGDNWPAFSTPHMYFPSLNFRNVRDFIQMNCGSRFVVVQAELQLYLT